MFCATILIYKSKIKYKAKAISESVYTIDESGSKCIWGVWSDLKNLFTKL